MSRTVFVIQWAPLEGARSSESDVWRDVPHGVEFDDVESVADALVVLRRRISKRINPTRVRAVKRIVSDEWVVGL